ncbi:MAG: RNA polymerase sigma factor [Nannocystaceae bacterium]|nr:RNA polymerase sigma factor [Myxococcales bacterium]
MTLDSSDDWAYLDAWRDGDKRAGERLATRYFALLMRFFLNKVRDVDDAADLVSETLLGCASSMANAAGGGSFRSYMFAIALNKLRGYYRKQAKRRRELEDFADICVAQSLPRSPSSIIARVEETQLLVNALRRLSLAQQIVVELNYFENLSGPEIASLLGVSTGTVYTHLNRGRQRLAAVVTELASDPKLAESTMTGLATWAHQVRDKMTPTPAREPAD